ncbi:antitoxin of toxin-antitoxin stability system [Ruegeria sp.]|uniref:antitoxin of toxin-antitoxin stability system n=1 Tax=Ruegeria sp. TaxID=1879320 RepID=UPI003B0056FE
MPTVIETTVFPFDELSDAARERAREWYRISNLDYEWWDCTCDDFSTICEILGVELKAHPVRLMGGGTRQKPGIRFSGFYSQGDGASFEGRLTYAKGSAARIKAYAPKDAELHDIAARLAAVQKRNFYQLYAIITQRGPYCHENTMQFDVRRDDAEATADAEDIIAEAMRDLARWLYARLETEYEFRNADEMVEESITANAYTFTSSGTSSGGRFG